MRYLVLSDIHANWEALTAVLEVARGRYDEIVCCGDFIGYGPDPNQVLEWARGHVSAAVRGNHDRACLTLEGLDDFNPVARLSALWTHEVLSRENAKYIAALPLGPMSCAGFSIAHGSPRDEDEYLIEEWEAAAAAPFATERVTFIGHTHLQGGFRGLLGDGPGVERIFADDNGGRMRVEEEFGYLINPGSVGQPRDREPNAAYLIYTPEKDLIEFSRVAYDVTATQTKIRSAGLPKLLAERLTFGR